MAGGAVFGIGDQIPVMPLLVASAGGSQTSMLPPYQEIGLGLIIRYLLVLASETRPGAVLGPTIS